jgi:cellulose biosynthesis protein BcsQ
MDIYQSFYQNPTNPEPSNILTPLKPNYDFIMLDNPPGKAMLAFNSLAAADLILIPASAERMAVDGAATISRQTGGRNV